MVTAFDSVLQRPAAPVLLPEPDSSLCDRLWCRSKSRHTVLSMYACTLVTAARRCWARRTAADNDADILCRPTGTICTPVELDQISETVGLL
jgi:hypothetical protein